MSEISTAKVQRSVEDSFSDEENADNGPSDLLLLDKTKRTTLTKNTSPGDMDLVKDTELAQILQREESRYGTRRRGQPVSYVTEFDSELEEMLQSKKKAKKSKKEARSERKTEEVPHGKNSNSTCYSETHSIDSILKESFIRFLKVHNLERTQEALGISKSRDSSMDTSVLQEIFQWEDCLSSDPSSALSDANLTRFREETCDILDRNPDLVWKRPQ
ncbi:hypothetical protein K7432_000765 [Basidiobolus ranarum]|uniref:Uncharacterized protein n=1 Tax=Basidiobolus ranarum TaxID=34480 RepID=A0ABR2WAP4_9FUNG